MKNPLMDRQFKETVNSDIRETISKTEAEQLRQPENLETWIIVLKSMKRSVDLQLSANKHERLERYAEIGSDETEWLKYRIENEKWRYNAIRFRDGVENRLAEANFLYGQQDSNIRYIQTLETAIRTHRKAVLEDTADDSTDDTLWEVLPN